MATDMLINMMRLIPTMNKTYIKPLNYYTAAVIYFTQMSQAVVTKHWA